ncbi:MAG: SpoIIE family protein phosphatase [Flavobacteriales bacterium]|nr:SpoIIE family protein phosphatase [Flavobacteriales bacterium]
MINRNLKQYYWNASILTVVLWLCGQSIYGQSYDFQTFTVENGLAQSQVLCLHQTNTGELWIGTNQGGINCYNGTNFKYISTENGLSDNVVYAINELGDRILAGTNNGLSIIEGTGISILNTENGLPHAGVVSILVSSKNEIWLGTGKGVAKLEGDSIKVVELDPDLSQSTIMSIREGQDGSIWFATVQNGVFRWNGKDILNITTDDGLDHNYVFDVMPINKFETWIFGYKGLYRLSGQELKREYAGSLISEHSIFYGYTNDKAGNVWIGTSNGVLKYANGKFKLFNKESGLVNNNIWKLLQDREGNLWFGSKSNGVSKLNSERFKIYSTENDLKDPRVGAVFRSKTGQFWLGTHQGVAVWNGNDRLFFEQKDGLISEVVRDIDEGPEGTIYIATDYGFNTYKDGLLVSYEQTEKNLNGCHDVFVDGNDVWFGTAGGVAKFENGTLIRPSNSGQFDSLVFDAVRHENDLWFAYEHGVLKYDGHTFVNLKAKDGFFDGRTRSVAVGPTGNLFFGTNKGIYMYNGDSCINISVDQGLISEAVYSLNFDAKGSLWVGQSKGLCRIYFDDKGNPTDVIRYGKAQGFMGLECSGNSIWTDEDGTVWIGATNGLVEYDPTQDKGLFFKPKTRITAVKVFSQETDWSQYTDSISLSGIPFNPEIPYAKNTLKFEYSGVSLTVPISMNYSYMLEGYDEDWSKITNNSEATYTNLSPGDYTFMVRAGFGDELWENEPISVSFTVLPPFYLTTWFFLFCALVASAIAYSYFAIQRVNRKITKQNLEIELQKDVIQKKNREMIDSINYASTIQSATLPTIEQWSKLLPDSFVLFKPKDIVSGDFYWLSERGDNVFFSAVDCTGHGVPGALMSIVGYNGLNQAISEYRLSEPAAILKHLSTSVNESLRKSEHDNYVKDGMDIALCKLNRNSMKLEFASAFNPLLIIRNGTEILIKGDRIAIGSMDTEERPFQNHLVQLEKGDCIYIYSDGYADQFGGELGKKLKTTVMRKKILEISSLPMELQKTELEKYLIEWQGSYDQVDDICVIGVRI